MGQHYGAKISRHGLILDLDAANPKSYPGTGTTWLDLSGNNNTATLGTDASYNSANRGTMLLSSSNTAGEITFSRDNFIFGSGDFTINLWANPTAIESFDTLYEMGYYTDGILFRPTGGSLEGPEDGVYVRGKLKDSNIIELPDYWTGLVHEDSITVNLTAIGKGQDLWVEDIVDNKVIVGGENVNCFYTIYGTRKDVDAFEVEY